MAPRISLPQQQQRSESKGHEASEKVQNKDCEYWAWVQIIAEFVQILE
jgi:hypothetical protein